MPNKADHLTLEQFLNIVRLVSPDYVKDSIAKSILAQATDHENALKSKLASKLLEVNVEAQMMILSFLDDFSVEEVLESDYFSSEKQTESASEVPIFGRNVEDWESVNFGWLNSPQ